MTVEAQAVLEGRIESAQIAAALVNEGYQGVFILQANDDATVIQVTEKAMPDKLQLWIFRPTDEFLDLFPGERTLVSVSPQGEGPDLVKTIAEVFGGYHRAEDLDHIPFTHANGRDELPKEPKFDLALVLQRLLPPAAAQMAIKVLWEDVDNAEYLRDALNRYISEAVQIK